MTVAALPEYRRDWVGRLGCDLGTGTGVCWRRRWY